MKRARILAAFVAALLVVSLTATVAVAAPGTTERVSVSSAEVQGNGISGRFGPSALSADGLTAAFDSEASNLVSGDTNVVVDVFARDRDTGITERVSVSSSEVQGNDDSDTASVNGDGQIVAFDSDATNLVSPDTNASDDVFVRNRTAGTTERVSMASDGTQGNLGSFVPDITPDGRFVVFISDASNLVLGDTNGTRDVFVRDRTTGTTERVSIGTGGVEGNGFSSPGAISDDGRFVAFGSFASNLVPGDTNANIDVFVHDRDTDTTTRVSVDSAGVEGNGLSSGAAISGNGNIVAFFSEATNLVPNDTNDTRDVFVHDRTSGITERVNVSSEEAQADAQSSFSVQGDSSNPRLSFDGNEVSFDSFATNLVPADTNGFPDAFVRDRAGGTTVRLSVDSAGVEGDDGSSDTDISADGLVVSFISLASNLVPNDTNTCGFFDPGHCPDVFVHDLGQTPPPPAGAADLSVTKTDSPDPVRVGGHLTYTLVVTNSGPETATDVTLTDTLPRTMRVVSTSTAAGSCAVAGPVVTCNLANIAVGASVTVTIRVTPTRSGSLTNMATVSFSGTDPDPVDNTDAETTTVRR